jgi:hypothetical protein
MGNETDALLLVYDFWLRIIRGVIDAKLATTTTEHALRRAASRSMSRGSGSRTRVDGRWRNVRRLRSFRVFAHDGPSRNRMP